MPDSDAPHDQKAERQKPRRQKPKTAAQRASEANKVLQQAVRNNTRRPDDRQVGQPQLQADHKSGLVRPLKR